MYHTHTQKVCTVGSWVGRDIKSFKNSRSSRAKSNQSFRSKWFSVIWLPSRSARYSVLKISASPWYPRLTWGMKMRLALVRARGVQTQSYSFGRSKLRKLVTLVFVSFLFHLADRGNTCSTLNKWQLLLTLILTAKWKNKRADATTWLVPLPGLVVSNSWRWPAAQWHS